MHARYTRECGRTPISPETVVAHCVAKKIAHEKLKWMKNKGLWLADKETLSHFPPPRPTSVDLPASATAAARLEETDGST